MQIIWITNYFFFCLSEQPFKPNYSGTYSHWTYRTLFGKLDVLSGNPNHVEAFLEPAPVLFFYSNILDTVGSKMALLASNFPLEASTNPIEGKSTLS
jgi:hypothetical protein